MAGNNTCISWENFCQIHQQQLQSIGLPEHLWKTLYDKLSPRVFHDATLRFDRRKNEEIANGRWTLHTKEALREHGDVFLIDHAWNNDGCSKAKEALLKKPELRRRMEDLLGLSEKDCIEEEGEFLDQEKVVQELGGVDEEKAKECVEKSKNDLIHALLHAEGGDQGKGPKMNVNLPQEKQLLDYEEFKYGFTASLDEEGKKNVSEEFIKKMYKKYLKDNEEFKTGEISYGQATTAKYSWNETDEDDGTVTVLISVPSNSTKSAILNKLTPSKWTFGVKGQEPIVNGEFYRRVVPDESFWMFDGQGVIQMTLQKADPDERLWPVLIKGEQQLSTEQIFDEAKEKEVMEKEEINRILDSMWYSNQTYQAVLVKGGPQQHVWYIMDEYGSALTHSSTPNMKCSPFAYAVNGVIYSLMWPITDIDKGALCTRNFCPSLSAIETPLHLEARQLACATEMPAEYPRSFLQDYAMSVPTAKFTPHKVSAVSMATDNKSDKSASKLELSLKFYAEDSCKDVRSVLGILGCSFVDKPEDADALWLRTQALNVTSSQRVNILSGDEFLVRRDALSRMIHKKCGEVPWFPSSFNLRSQLPAFCVEHYNKGVTAMWVLRCANPNESNFRPVISSNLRRIIRLGETAPLIASQFYISVAVSHKKLFCLQYSVIVPSLKPLSVLIHNTPRIRTTPKKFDPMDDLDEYDSSELITKSDTAPQNAETMKEFLEDFEKSYLIRRQSTWEEVKKNIDHNIYELFLAVSSSLSRPGTVGSEKQGIGNLCAVYGVDVLVLDDLTAAVIGVDAVPSFANDQAAKEVLYVAYTGQELPATLGSRFSKVTCED